MFVGTKHKPDTRSGFFLLFNCLSSLLLDAVEPFPYNDLDFSYGYWFLVCIVKQKYIALYCKYF